MSPKRSARIAFLAPALALAPLSCGDGPSEVTLPPVHTVEVGPADRVLAVGDTMRLTAYPTAADGTILGSVRVDWSTDAEAVAAVRSIGAFGTVQAKSPGTARVSATSDGRTGTVTVTVLAAPLQVAAVEIAPASAALDTGRTLRVEAIARAADGTAIGGRSVRWSSSDSTVVSVATINNETFAGVRAHRAGVATIRAAVDGRVGEARIEARAP